MLTIFDPLDGVRALAVHHADQLFSKREAPIPLYGARRRQPTFSRAVAPAGRPAHDARPQFPLVVL